MPCPASVTSGAIDVRQGRLTPAAWVDDCLRRIHQLDARLHAWVVVDEAAARRTAEILTDEAAQGMFRGPLHGVPLGIKDIIDVAGLPTRAGSPLREGHLATVDAPLVVQLRAAGAIVLGKTVTVEFACFDPSPTRNPWDPELRRTTNAAYFRTIWGCFVSGAARAARFSDCNTGRLAPCRYKVSGIGRTPGGSSSGSAVAVAAGMCPGTIGTQTGGSLVRPAGYCGVATLKPTFGQVSTVGIVPVSFHLDHPGPMARCVEDLAILWQCLRPAGGSRPDKHASQAEACRLARPPRLGWIEAFAEHADATIRNAMETALEKLRMAGATIVSVGFPESLKHVQARHRQIMAVEAAAYHRSSFAAHRTQYGPMLASLLDEGLTIAGVDYADALAWQRQYAPRVAELLTGCDALIAPSIDTTAPPTLETTGSNLLQAPFSCAGLPVVAFPCGLADDGMPAGIQLVGPRHAEDGLLALARWCEDQLGFCAQNAWPV